MSPFSSAGATGVSRRHFLQAAGAGLFVLGLPRGAWPEMPAQQVLHGTDFNLDIAERSVDFTGRRRTATVVNGQLPGPLLRWREGDTVTLRVANSMATSSSIHWHGLILPADMDGVPGLSFAGIPSGGQYVYRFAVNQSGTYWYHAHTRFQEQTGLYGPIIVTPREGERHRTERDYVVMLSDWTDLDPERIYAVLKKQSHYFNFGKRTTGDFFADWRAQGLRQTLADRRMWAQMRMNPTDIQDVSGYAYTYLMNGVPPAGNWTGLFRRGERVRLRFINGSSMSFFDIRIPGLKLTVVATDGQEVEPVTVDEFRIGTAETYDVIVTPQEDQPYSIFAQAMDRSGFACGTLSPRPGLSAPVPSLDPRPLLAMRDMGHDMGHGGQGQAAHQQQSVMQGAEHADHAAPARMDHSAHAAHGHAHGSHAADAEGGVAHPASERSLVDMQVMATNDSLDDPGVGLRDNGRRVLTYADLHTLGGPIDRRSPEREIQLHLTGHMERFVWSFDGQKFSESEPLLFKLGERLRITLVNDSMMTHPIHLHGMWSEVEQPDGQFQVRKHTVVVQPAQRVSYAVTADAPGKWAYHCHLLYHMEAGMFREVHVADSHDHRGHGHGGDHS